MCVCNVRVCVCVCVSYDICTYICVYACYCHSIYAFNTSLHSLNNSTITRVCVCVYVCVCMYVCVCTIHAHTRRLSQPPPTNQHTHQPPMPILSYHWHYCDKHLSPLAHYTLSVLAHYALTSLLTQTQRNTTHTQDISDIFTANAHTRVHTCIHTHIHTHTLPHTHTHVSARPCTSQFNTRTHTITHTHTHNPQNTH